MLGGGGRTHVAGAFAADRKHDDAKQKRKGNNADADSEGGRSERGDKYNRLSVSFLVRDAKRGVVLNSVPRF